MNNSPSDTALQTVDRRDRRGSQLSAITVGRTNP